MPDTIETLLRRLALTGATTGGGSVGSLAGSLAGYPLVAYANAIQPGNRVNPQTGYGSLNQFIQSVQAVQQPRDANEPIPSYLQGAPAANRLASRQRYTPDELLGASGRNSTNMGVHSQNRRSSPTSSTQSGFWSGVASALPQVLDDLKNVKPDTRTNAQRVIANGAARVGMTPEAYVAASKRFGVPSVEMGYDGRQATKRFIEEMKEPSYLFTGGGRAVGAALTGANEADTPSFMSALLNVNAPGADRELAKMNGAQAQLAKFAMNAVEPENIALTIAGGALGKASPLLGQILSGIFAGQMGAQAFKQAEEGDLNGALVTAGFGGWQGLHAAGVEMPTLFNQDGSVPGERQNAAPDPKGRPAKTTAKQRRQQVQLDEYNKIQDDIARVRHYTSKDGVTGIKRSQSITPARKKDGVIGVHVERQPFGPMQGAAEEMGIAVPRGKPFGYVEFNAPDSLQETYGVGPRSTGVIPSEDGPLDISGLDPKYVQMALLQRLLQRNGWHYFAP